MKDFLEDIWNCFLGIALIAFVIVAILSGTGFLMFGLNLLANGGQL